VELDQVTDAGPGRLLEGRDAHAVVQRAVSREALELIPVERDMPNVAAVLEQALANEERRDRKAEADLDCSPSVFSPHPLAQRRPLGGPDRDRREVAACQEPLPDFPDALQARHHWRR
jgi:hypothetical protein